MTRTDDRTGGMLIVNADDWGRDPRTTNCIAECVARGTVSAVSAMVLMADSTRAADLAVEHGVDAGLHLNFTTPFDSPECPRALAEPQRRIATYLRRHRLAQIVFNPALAEAFADVTRAQIDEYRRLYGREPGRIDGHHHMHLCANVLMRGLLPPATIVRRNFSFGPGEKTVVNRGYRWVVDRALARDHWLTDYLFSLPPLAPPARLDRILSLARGSVVELETHPVRPDEHRFLTGGEFARRADGICIDSFRTWRRQAFATPGMLRASTLGESHVGN
jgi:YdjC-like protein